MPARIYRYKSFDELKELASYLATAVSTGATQELRSNNSGFTKKTGPVSQDGLERSLMNVRYEIYLRGQRGTEPEDIPAKELEPKNPYSERVMRVECYNHASRLAPRINGE